LASPPDSRRRPRRASFTFQFALILIVVGIATAVAAAAVAWFETQNARSQQQLASASGSARLGISLVRLESATVSAGLSCQLGALPQTAVAFVQGSSALQQQAVSEASSTQGHVVVYLSPAGEVLAGSAGGAPLGSLQPTATAAHRSGLLCSAGGAFVAWRSGIYGVAMSKVSGAAHILGYVLVLTPVSANTLRFAAQLLTSGGSSTQLLLVAGGRYVFSGKAAAGAQQAGAVASAAVTQAISGPKAVGTMTVGGQQFTVAGQLLRPSAGPPVATLVVVQSATTVGPSASQLAVPVALAVASVLLLGMMLVFVLAERYLNRPLRRLNQAVQRLGQDVYATPVEIDGAEEVTRLAANFEIMRRQLRHQLLLALGRSVIASTLTGNAPLEQALSQVLKSLCHLLNTEMAMILLRAQDSAGLSFLITCGIAEPNLEWSELEQSEGILGRLLREPRFLARSLLNSSDRGALEQRIGLRDCLAEPLEAEGRNIGVLIVANKRAPYLEEDTAICHAVAAQMVTAVDKSVQLVVTRREATTDAMTGLYNYRFLVGYLDQQVNVAERASANLSVLMLDLDHFKSVNDSFGHLIGDRVLRAVAAMVLDTIRKSDLAARYGGEEFVVVMANTGREEAHLVAEKIRQAVAGLEIPRDDGGLVPITVSIGGVSFPEGTRGARNLLDLADRALYHAKRSGRDRVEFLDAAIFPERPTSNRGGLPDPIA